MDMHRLDGVYVVGSGLNIILLSLEDHISFVELFFDVEAELS